MTYEISGDAGGKIICGDCVEKSEQIPSGSVDLILTDPPYGTMKGVGGGIVGWDDNTVDWDDAIPPKTLIEISDKILRKGGRAIFFSQEPYTSKMITQATANLPFSYRMVWKKDVHGNTLLSNVAPVNMFEDIVVFTKSYDSEGDHPLRSYSKQLLEYIGYFLNEINKDLGHRRAEHFFYVGSSQFELCTQETYTELIEEYSIDNMDGFKEYAEIKAIAEAYQPTFNLPEEGSVKPNVLEYKKPHQGKHPTQKPVALLEDLITTFTNKSGLVVDLTAGSGSTAVAAHNTNRECIAIEKDADYYETATERVSRVDDSHVSQNGQYNLEAYL